MPLDKNDQTPAGQLDPASQVGIDVGRAGDLVAWDADAPGGRPVDAAVVAVKGPGLKAAQVSVDEPGVEEPETVVGAIDQSHGVGGRRAVLFEVVDVGVGMPIEQHQGGPGFPASGVPL